VEDSRPPKSAKKKAKEPEVLGAQALEPVPVGERDPLALYMREVSKIPLLTPDEEHQLALRVHEHQDPEAIKKLVASNLRFVVKIAFEYARYGAKVLDLVQEGNVGLMRAVRDFNPYKDVRLTTYAVYWIRSYIQDFLLRNWSIVRIGTTAAQKKLFYNLKKEQEKFEREGLKPELKQIAHKLSVDESDVKLMQERMSGRDLSLSAPVGGDEDNSVGLTLSNTVADSAPLASSELEASEQASLFRKALGEFRELLDERERAILEDRLLSESPKTLVEIGEEYGVTKERARQIEERIKNKLKDFLAERYPDISLG
jgi:RNA polymerase sigma-32 factor